METHVPYVRFQKMSSESRIFGLLHPFTQWGTLPNDIERWQLDLTLMPSSIRHPQISPKGIFLKTLGSQQRSTANSNLRKQNLTSLDVPQINYFCKATTCDMWLGALYTPRIFQGVGVPCFNHSSSGLLCATEQHQHFQVR